MKITNEQITAVLSVKKFCADNNISETKLIEATGHTFADIDEEGDDVVVLYNSILTKLVKTYLDKPNIKHLVLLDEYRDIVWIYKITVTDVTISDVEYSNKINGGKDERPVNHGTRK